METTQIAQTLLGSVDSSENSEEAKVICNLVIAKVGTSLSVFTWPSSD